MKKLLMSVLSQKYIEILRRVKLSLSLAMHYLSDGCRYIVYSKCGESSSVQQQAIFRIMELSHALEKGMSLPNAEPGHGKKQIRKLESLLGSYEGRFGCDIYASLGRNALQEHEKFQGKTLISEEWSSRKKDLPSAGTVLLDADWQAAVRKAPFPQLVRDRVSVRIFSDRKVERSLVVEAIDEARFSPSSCNRQTSRLRLYEDQEQIQRILRVQRGAGGFAETVPSLLIVSFDLRGWDSSNERYQGFVDGGMFAMSLIYALTCRGLGTCCLNLSLDLQREKELRKVASIPEWESFLMCIACGWPEPKSRVALSGRLPINDILIES